MATAAPTGREREYETLLAAARDAAGGRGSIVLLAGRTGTGKNSLVRALAQNLGDDYEVSSVVLYDTSTGSRRSARSCAH